MDKRKRNGEPGLPWHDAVQRAVEPRAIGLAGQWLDGNHKLQEGLEWLVLPPLLAGQFRVWRRGTTPVAYAAWALLDQTTEDRLLAGDFRLGPADWRSGDRLWLIYLLAPYGGLAGFARELRQGVFAGREVRFLAGRPGTNPQVEVWSPLRRGCGKAGRNRSSHPADWLTRPAIHENLAHRAPAQRR